MLVVKQDFSVELFHVVNQDDKEENEDMFTVCCETEVKEELLKGLLRDRGKGIQFIANELYVTYYY